MHMHMDCNGTLITKFSATNYGDSILDFDISVHNTNEIIANA